ncbi:MAG: hypothetical protein ACK47B_23760 [Armatimonadota bacterium]
MGGRLTKLVLQIQSQFNSNGFTQLRAMMAEFMGVLRSLGPLADRVTRTLTSGFGSVANAVRRSSQAVARAVQGIGQGLGRLGAVFDRVAQRARTAFAGIRNAAAQAISNHFGGPLTALIGAVGAVGLGVGAFNGGRQFAELGIGANRFRENVLASLEAMTKSKQASEELYAFLSKFSDVTPFDDEEVIEAGKALLTFGFDAREMLSLVGDTAFSLKIPLEQVVTAMAKLKAGMFDLSEMAPVGITREGLEQFGAKFSKSGEAQNRDALLPAGIALLQSRFGGAMQNASSGFDAAFSTMVANWRRVAMKATTVLFESLKPAFEQVSSVLEDVLKNERLVNTLRVVFDAVGRAIAGAAAHLPRFVAWLEKVAAADGFRLLLLNIIALIQTVGERLLGLMGIDFAKMLDPKAIHAWVEQVGVTVAGAVDTFYGLVRVFEEVRVIVSGVFADMLATISDFTEDTGRFFTRLFLGLENTIAEFSATLMESFLALADGLNRVELFGQRPFAIDTTGIEDALWNVPAERMHRRAKFDSLDEDERTAAAARAARDAARNRQDPFRHDPFGQRMHDAFTGRNRDTSAQDAFWRDFERNRIRIAKGLWAGSRTQGSAEDDLAPQMMLIGMTRSAGAVATATATDAAKAQEKIQEQLAEHVDLLEAQVSMWSAVVEASQSYAEGLGDQSLATRGVLQGLLGQLAALNRLHGAQAALVAAQTPWTKEWMEGLAAINKTAAGLTGLRESIRELLFDVSRLNAADDVQSKLFSLGKEAGFGAADMMAIAQERQALLVQTLLTERARLATVEQGTVEWFKQRSTIVDIVAKIVSLRKELGEVNQRVGQPMLTRPGTPFGVRGSGPEAGVLPDGMGGDFGRMIQQLLGFALNPAPIDLDREAQRLMGGGDPVGMLPKGATASPVAQQGGVTVAPQVNVNVGTVNDVAEIQRIATEVVRTEIGSAFSKLRNYQQDRRGGG